MAIQAGFAQIDITPPVGTHKIGWLKEIIGDSIADPLYARVAVFESNGETLAFVQLDTLSIRWTQTNAIRQRLAAQHGYPGDRVMVAAVHNHAGPAIANCGDVQRDERYIGALVEKVATAFGEALDSRQEAQVGLGSGFEFDVAHNRRVVQRDGTVRTHGSFKDPNALYVEGPIDPEVGVLAARDAQGRLLGAIVNYACHPTHHGGDTVFSGGYPGVLAATMQEQGCPVALFLNGAAGNIHTSDPAAGGVDLSMDEAGHALASDALGVIGEMEYRTELGLASLRRTVDLPYRKPTEDEVHGTVRGAQRFVDLAIYDRTIPGVVERIRERRVQPAEVQVHFIDDYAFVSLPGECFVELGLEIKQRAHPRHALVVACANGMVGYVPHRAAFERGGYETTFGANSRLAPEAGDLLVDCAQEALASGPCYTRDEKE